MAGEPGTPAITVLFGPTALGKTAIAVELAGQLGAEIVVADSMQVYAGVPILTNQPTSEERRRAVHHLVGFVDPREDYSVAAYAEAASDAIDDILARGRPVLVEGGSGLYVRAALGGLDFGPPPARGLRETLERRLRDEGVEALAEELRRRDPETAVAVDTDNPRRVIRALERVLASAEGADAERDRLWTLETGRPCRFVALNDDRDVIRHRVDERVEQMVAGGALDEVRRLCEGDTPSRTLSQAIGVQELGACDRGECSLEQAVARMQARTRRLVRRQLTWMRKLPVAARIPVRGRPPTEVAAEIAAGIGGSSAVKGGHRV